MTEALKTFFLAMTPVNELRGTIPLALWVFNLPPLKAYFFAVLGNAVPPIFIIFFLKNLSNLLRKIPVFQRFFTWLFERTYQKFYKKYSFYGDLALVFFVAIPLPMTGAWTGSVAAFLFKIPYWRALLLIFLGILISGAIVTLASLGIINLAL